MQNKKLLRNAVLVLIIFTVLIIFVSSNITYEMFLEVVRSMNYYYFYMAIGIILLYILMHFASLYNVLKIYTNKVSFREAYHIATCAHFYNGITPFSAGGQPFQIYYLGKRGLAFDESTGVITMNFIVYQFVIFILSIFSISMLWIDLSASISNFSLIVIVGFSANSLIFLFLILFSVSKKFKKIVFGVIFGLLKKLPFFKNKAPKWEITSTKFIDDFQRAMNKFSGNYLRLFISVIYRALGMVVFFTLPYVVFKALGVQIDVNAIISFVGFAAFAHIFYTFIPLPGSSGGAEFAFYTLYATIGALSTIQDKEHILLLGLLMWRLIAYYFAMFVGFISTMFLENREVKRT